MDLISVIIPAYNHQDYIEKCISSVAAQDYSNKEIIIINDGSTDNTNRVVVDLLPEISSKFVNVIYKNKENEGIASSLNLGLSLAKGEYIVTLASDDFYIDNKAFSKLHNLASQDEKIGLVWSDCQIVNDKGKRVSWDSFRSIVNFEEDITSAKYNSFVEYFMHNRQDVDLSFIKYEDLLKGNFIANVLFLKKSIVECLGGYEMGLEDWSMWIKILQDHKIKYVDECLGAYRWHSSNLSHNMPLDIVTKTIDFLLTQKEFCKSKGLVDTWSRIVFSIVETLPKENVEQYLHVLLEIDTEVMDSCSIEWLKEVYDYSANWKLANKDELNRFIIDIQFGLLETQKEKFIEISNFSLKQDVDIKELYSQVAKQEADRKEKDLTIQEKDLTIQEKDLTIQSAVSWQAGSWFNRAFRKWMP